MSSRLSPIACLCSALGLCAGLVISILATIGVIEVPWNSMVLPAAGAFGLVPLCLIALVISLVALLKERSGLSVLAVVLGLAALCVSILTTMLLFVAGAASNPV